MKVIDLLVKMANGEEVPKQIKYDEETYTFCNDCKMYENDEVCSLLTQIDNFNDEVEILKELEIKFHTGDRVKSLINDEGWGVKKGDIGTVLENDINPFINFDNNTLSKYAMNQDELELVEESKEVDFEDIEKLKKISYQIVGYYDNDINRIVRDFNKQIKQIGDNINSNVDIINKIIENQNKIIKELNANSNRN